MSVWYRDNFGILTRMDQTPHNNMEGHEEEGRARLQLHVPKQVTASQGRHTQDYLNPTRESTPSCIILPANAHTLVIKTGILPSLPTFHGMESESTYLHKKEFEKMVGTMVDGPQREDIVHLKLFPFSLKDRAKIWLNSLRACSITSWGIMQDNLFYNL